MRREFTESDLIKTPSCVPHCTSFIVIIIAMNIAKNDEKLAITYFIL